jgi:SWI/SNF-related matrix-associated actin-dependent regulator of chromatin subfamily D
MHTSPLEPIRLPYTIRVDSEFHNSDPKPTVYDVRIAVDDPLRAAMLAVTTSPDFTSMLRQVSGLDDQLAVIVQALHHSRAKHNFFSAMGRDPVAFIKRWMNSQRRDLETILGEGTRGGGEDASGPEFRRGGANGAWDSAVAKETVRYLLAKPGAR